MNDRLATPDLAVYWPESVRKIVFGFHRTILAAGLGERQRGSLGILRIS